MTYGKFAPFIHTDKTSAFMEASLFIALLPLVACAVFKYGLRALILVLSSAVLSALWSMLFVKSASRKISIQSVTGAVMFALMLPPDTSLVIVAVATALMAFFTEIVFGGTAFMPVTIPAAVRVMVELMWPNHLTGFNENGNLFFSLKPLVTFSQTSSEVTSSVADYHIAEIIAGGYPSFIGLSSVLMMLIGFVYLLHSRTVRLSSSLSYIITLILLRTTFHFKDGFRANLVFFLASGVFFVAFYLLPSRSTMPKNSMGQIIAGVICGILTIGAFEITLGILPLCVPVVAVNLLSGIIDYLTSDASQRHERLKEEAQ